jgi:glycosyltransferase involved in cell wall biosynthesis
MKIALIGHGMLPIPPVGWGAVEGTIWLRKTGLERLGHEVVIYNTPMIHEAIFDINRRSYDFVHCHSELLAWCCNRHLRVPYALTSHFGGWHRFVPGGDHYQEFDCLFQETLGAPAHFAVSERIREVYRRSGYAGFLGVLPNAVETERFRCADRGNGRVICVGVISPRKRQAWLAEATRGQVAIDFVGPWDQANEPQFREHETARYLGAWDRATLHERLTDYSCLVLLSHSEAAPKVVLEALAAGLDVVTNEACAANLTAEPFITVLPDEPSPAQVVSALRAAVDANPTSRRSIRAYAVERLDYAVANARYLSLIGQLRERFATPPATPRS